MKYDISLYNIHIEDSYLVSKHAMMQTLKVLREENEVSYVWLRSFKSLKAEWIVHNALYKFGLYKERTRSVDMDYPSDKPSWLYISLSWVLRWFIG